MHRAFEFTGDSQWHDIERTLYRRIDLIALFAAGTVQHVIDDLIAVTGMPDAHT